MRRRKTSEAQRRLNAKKALQRYRENNRELDLERNRKLNALRRKDETYRLQERIKNLEYVRRKRQSKKYTKENFRSRKRLTRKQLVSGFQDVEHKREKKSTKDIKKPKRLSERLAKRLAAKFASQNDSDDQMPVRNEIDLKETNKLSYYALKAYGDKKCEHFSKLENYYLQKDCQSKIKSDMNKNVKSPPQTIQIYISGAEFCIPVPLKKSHLQCSTDDDEDGFQEVSEDENNPSSFLDQGERMHSGGNEDGSELIDAANIKTEMKIEPTQIGEDDSMDLDPNYDPSDFLTMHNRMGNNESNQQQQQDNKMSQFLQQDEVQNDNMQAINDNKPNMHQMPLMMGSNDNMGIDDDLAISESDEEDEGNVRVKREIFTDQMDDEQQQHQQQQQHSMMDMQMQQQQQQQQQEQLPLQPYADIDQQQQQQPQHHQPQNQSSHHDDNNDDDWLRF